MFFKKTVKNKISYSFSKTKLTAVLILFLFCTSFLILNYASAQGTGLEEAAGRAGLKKTEIPVLAKNITNVVLSFVGVIFFIILLYGGFMWMTAGGNEEKVSKAKTLITQATIGLIIVITAYGITHFILSSLIS